MHIPSIHNIVLDDGESFLVNNELKDRLGPLWHDVEGVDAQHFEQLQQLHEIELNSRNVSFLYSKLLVADVEKDQLVASH